MKDKLNKVVATGLLALMIANFSACDQVPLIGVETDTNGNIITNEGPNSSNGNNTSNNTIGSGSIWEALKSRDAMASAKFPFSDYEFEGMPLPLTFLNEQGLFYIDHYNKLKLTTGTQAQAFYHPFSCYAFIDENSTENDVYLILQFQSGKIIENQDNPDVYLATWQLKYTLADDDYQTFLNMQNDWRIRLFIQEMDKQYEPEVISKCVIAQDISHIGSHVRNEKNDKDIFPYIFATNIDYDNQILTFAGISDEGIRYFDVDMRKSNAWGYAQTMDGLTEEECEQVIQIVKTSTLLGDCLTKFSVNYRSAGLTVEQAKEAFNTTQNIAYLTPIDINERDNTYNYHEIVK